MPRDNRSPIARSAWQVVCNGAWPMRPESHPLARLLLCTLWSMLEHSGCHPEGVLARLVQPPHAGPACACLRPGVAEAPHVIFMASINAEDRVWHSFLRATTAFEI